MNKFKLCLYLFTIFNYATFSQAKITELDDGTFMVSLKKKPVDNLKYENAYQENDYIFVFKTNKDGIPMQGVYSNSGKKIIPAEYSSIELPSSEHKTKYFVAKNQDKSFFFDSEGKLLSSTNYTVSQFCGGNKLIATECVNENNQTRYGFMNVISGKEISSCEVQYWTSVGNDYVTIKKDGKAGLLSSEGIAAPMTYETVEHSGDSSVFSLYGKDNNITVFLGRENKVLAGTYTEVYSTWPMIVLKIKEKEIVIYDQKEKTFLKDTFEAHNPLYGAGSVVKQKQNWYFLDPKGDPSKKIKGEWDFCTLINKNMLLVKKGSFGLASRSGNLKTELKYDTITLGGYLENPVCFITSKNNKYGIITLDGKEAIEPVFEFAYWVNDNPKEWIIIKSGEKHGLFNYLTKTIIQPEYDYINKITGDDISIKKNGRHGIINAKGEIKIPIEYDYAFQFIDNVAEVAKEGKKFFINRKNEVVTVKKQ